MLEKFNKILISVSIIVLFGLYALEKQTQDITGTSADTSLLVTPLPALTATPNTAVVVSTVTVTPSASGNRNVGLNAQSGSTIADVPATDQPATEIPATDVPATSTVPAGQYADGTYLGDVTDAHWGDVQVQVTIANGEIQTVAFVTYPDHRSRSRSINKRAIPILLNEAVQSQKAKVDIVSGATDTSRAFIQSLQSALDQAA